MLDDLDSTSMSTKKTRSVSFEHLIESSNLSVSKENQGESPRKYELK